MKNDYIFDWADLAFASKKKVRDLNAIFISAPREMSQRRFKQIVKEYLPKANLLVGVSKESYVLGLEDQPQFKMLKSQDIKPVVETVKKSNSKNKAYIMHYSQRDLVYILEKLKPQKVLFINGSWYHGFHHRPEFYTLNNLNIPYEKISPFADEKEAKEYELKKQLEVLPTKGLFSQTEMMELANMASKHSYDFAAYQTACALGRKKGTKYELITTSHNRIVPYETYAMHNGSIREKNYSPTNDLNFYDTIHYEVSLILKALAGKFDLTGTTIFETVLSCPHCTRMLAATGIDEIVYQHDHSDGYAIKMLQAAGKKVRRLVI
jgi:deoxycytidylate deaminase